MYNNNNINNTLNKNISKSKNIIPIITYINLEINKPVIYKDNEKKSGIYRLSNYITGKSYIGSSISLTGRFSIYYSTKAMQKKLSEGSSAIYGALIKYGYSNFNLDILEYCEPNLLIEREQYYIDLLKPQYNILKIAGNRLGSKQSEETKAKMSISNKGKNHYFYGKMHTYETRKKISLTLKSLLNVKNKPKIVTLETRLKMSLRCHGVSVKLYKDNNFIKEFPTITSVGKYFNVSDRTIRRYLESGKSYNDYIFKANYKDN